MSAAKIHYANLQDVLNQQIGTTELRLLKHVPITAHYIVMLHHQLIKLITSSKEVQSFYFPNRIVAIVEEKLMIRLILRHLAQQSISALIYQRKMEFLQSLIIVHLWQLKLLAKSQITKIFAFLTSYKNL